MLRPSKDKNPPQSEALTYYAGSTFGPIMA